MAKRPDRQTGGRALLPGSILNDTPEATPEPTFPYKPGGSVEQARVPPHYTLLPANPSPFEGTLEASLDAMLGFTRSYPEAMFLMDVLRAPASTQTNWSELLETALKKPGLQPRGRLFLEDLFFLVARKLFPEQIAENRKLMARMYEVKKSQSTRTVLRYDMLLQWNKRNNSQPIVVESRPLPAHARPWAPPPGYDQQYSGRHPHMANVWATLIAGPPQGWVGPKKTEAMKHHVTGIDEILMFTDREVGGWSTVRLILKTAHTLLLWQWLRSNTEKLEDMEVDGWKELEGRADESEWVREGRKIDDRE